MDRAKEIYYHYLQDKGIRNSAQREKILDIFLGTGKHMTAFELLDMVKGQAPEIGQATVYRAIKVICDAGLAEEIDFGDGTRRYELKYGHKHHDHLICTVCGRLIEVYNQDIERLQKKMCDDFNFKSQSHRLHIFGICKDCQKKKN